MGHLQPIGPSSCSWEFPELYQVYDARGLSETLCGLVPGESKGTCGSQVPWVSLIREFPAGHGMTRLRMSPQTGFRGTDTSSEVDLGIPMNLPEFPTGGSVHSHNSQTRGMIPGCLDTEPQRLAPEQLSPAHPPAHRHPSPYPLLAED